MPWESPEDRKVASTVLEAIRSEKYKKKNDLFLKPFDLNEVPGYVEKVGGKPLDLQTIASHFDSYDKESFWRDLELVFTNAIRYHGDVKERKWIAKVAKDMLKAVKKEKSSAEGGGKSAKPRKPSKPKLPTAASAAKAAPPKLSPADSTPATEAPPAPAPKKLKIKLSMKPSVKKAKPVQAKVEPPKPKPRIKASLSKAPPPPPAAPVAPPPAAAPPVQKINPSAGVRGKELPQGVVLPPVKPAKPAAKPTVTKPTASSKPSTKPLTAKSLPMSKSSNTSKAKTQKKTKTTTSTTNNSSNTAAAAATGSLDEARKRQMAKVILGLKRRRHKQLSWFLSPITDKNILPDYKLKIHKPMDIGTIQDKSNYKSIEAFCLDVRQVFANALIYNTNIKDSLRPLAVQVLETAEMLFEIFLRKPYPDSYKPLLYCWKLCIGILDALYNLAKDGQSFAYYFSYPVAYYCGGSFPADYLQKVGTPMDFGTVTEKLITGVYQTVEAFCSDCERIISNCRLYYAGRDDGKVFLDHAEALDKVMKTQMNQLRSHDRKKGLAEKQKLLENSKTVTSRLILPNKPPVSVYLSVLEELRALQYTDKATKITEPATGPFEEVPCFPDYSSVVAEPMDLKTVTQKVTIYDTPEDFEYDVNLTFKNAEQYNTHRGDQHSVTMAKYALRKFRSIFYSKMSAFENPEAAAKNNHLRISITAPPPKQQKVAPQKKGNITPRSSAQQAKQTQNPQQPQQPVPLHIAIAKVKEAFPLRRAVKSLQSWEADCARYFKELMRHPWITTVRPKFIFHVPVSMLFPELKGPYEAKIRRPMDLTTIECTLLAGNRYSSPESFVSDVALVFSNSVLFNKEGKDVGDLLSCAYYDASVHLLRYARWLSLELLVDHIDPSGNTDVPSDGLPPFNWQLTAGNRKLARSETEGIVMKEPLEKSLEGDRYTWMETECEKLLKALRHQSDLKHMKYFIQPNYPPDYTAFIAKPMDWEKVQKTLKKRHYDTIGQVVEDLRLIFSNALKYNARHKDTDAISNEAYEAAEIMSQKLEVAINKMLLSIADRLERERIDHANAEREIEAAERAEEAEFRASWKKEGGGDKEPLDVKIRMHRRGAQRRQAMDFEVPLFDEEEAGSAQHERSFVEVVKFQKGLYEKQRKDKLRVRSIAKSVGTTLIERAIQKQIANRVKAHQEAAKAAAKKNVTEDSKEDMMDVDQPPSVLRELEKPDRGVLQLKINVPKKPSKKRKRFINKSVFGGDSDSE